MKKAKFGPPLDPICPQFRGGGYSSASPQKISDVMPPYLKTLFEQKTEIFNLDHFSLNDPL